MRRQAGPLIYSRGRDANRQHSGIKQECQQTAESLVADSVWLAQRLLVTVLAEMDAPIPVRRASQWECRERPTTQVFSSHF